MDTLSKISPLEKLRSDFLEDSGVELFVKRDDLIHPLIQGNKWRKLKFNLSHAQELKKEVLLTFGGYHSNHIYALSAAAKEFGFRSVGIIRGEEPLVKNYTLQFAAAQGMTLVYWSREQYKRKDSPEALENLRSQFGDFYLLPEGGTNLLALDGVKEVCEELTPDFDYLCVSCGTGGTLAGLVTGMSGSKKLLGFSSLKGIDTLTASVNKLVKEYSGEDYSNFEINFNYHFGGYAKVTEELIDFVKDFKRIYNIQLEPVYTGKMFFGLFDLTRKNYFPKGSRIVAIHTGGLQGLRGYSKYFQTLN